MASTDRTISHAKSLRARRLRGSVQKLAGQGPLISCDPAAMADHSKSSYRVDPRDAALLIYFGVLSTGEE
jgi:hypothetical protein